MAIFVVGIADTNILLLGDEELEPVEHEGSMAVGDSRVDYHSLQELCGRVAAQGPLYTVGSGIIDALSSCSIEIEQHDIELVHHCTYPVPHTYLALTVTRDSNLPKNDV